MDNKIFTIKAVDLSKSFNEMFSEEDIKIGELVRIVQITIGTALIRSGNSLDVVEKFLDRLCSVTPNREVLEDLERVLKKDLESSES